MMTSGELQPGLPSWETQFDINPLVEFPVLSCVAITRASLPLLVWHMFQNIFIPQLFSDNKISLIIGMYVCYTLFVCCDLEIISYFAIGYLYLTAKTPHRSRSRLSYPTSSFVTTPRTPIKLGTFSELYSFLLFKRILVVIHR